MKVLTLATEFPPARGYGLGRYIAEHSAALAAAGVESHVACNNHDGVSDSYDREGARVHNAPFPIPVQGHTWINEAMQGNSLLVARGARIADEHGPFDVIQAHDWLAASAARSLQEMLGIPLVLTMHDTQIGKALGELTDDQRYIAEVEAWICGHADAVVANSFFMGRELSQAYKVPDEKLDVIHCGVNPKSFETDADPKLFRTLFCEPGERLVGFVGRLAQVKGPHVLLEAVPKVLRACPNTKFVIAGEGALRDGLERHAAGLDVQSRVQFTGYLSGQVLSTFYRAADVMAAPSLYEPFGMVALEASVCGTPVVAGDTGGLSEIVEDGETGVKVPPNDPDALASAIVKLLVDVRRIERMGIAANRHARSNFSWHAVARKQIEVYEKVLAA